MTLMNRLLKLTLVIHLIYSMRSHLTHSLNSNVSYIDSIILNRIINCKKKNSDWINLLNKNNKCVWTCTQFINTHYSIENPSSGIAWFQIVMLHYFPPRTGKCIRLCSECFFMSLSWILSWFQVPWSVILRYICNTLQYGCTNLH